MRKKTSAILEALLETVTGLSKVGVIDQITLREFDRLCLLPVEPLQPIPSVQKRWLEAVA